MADWSKPDHPQLDIDNNLRTDYLTREQISDLAQVAFESYNIYGTWEKAILATHKYLLKKAVWLNDPQEKYMDYFEILGSNSAIQTAFHIASNWHQEQDSIISGQTSFRIY